MQHGSTRACHSCSIYDITNVLIVQPWAVELLVWMGYRYPWNTANFASISMDFVGEPWANLGWPRLINHCQPLTTIIIYQTIINHHKCTITHHYQALTTITYQPLPVTSPLSNHEVGACKDKKKFLQVTQDWASPRIAGWPLGIVRPGSSLPQGTPPQPGSTLAWLGALIREDGWGMLGWVLPPSTARNQWHWRWF